MIQRIDLPGHAGPCAAATVTPNRASTASASLSIGMMCPAQTYGCGARCDLADGPRRRRRLDTRQADWQSTETVRLSQCFHAENGTSVGNLDRSVSMRSLNKWILAMGCALLAAAASSSQAQPAWPTRPIVYVVPFAAGGNTD